MSVILLNIASMNTRIFSVYRSSAGSGKTRTLAKEYLKLALKFKAGYFRHILAVTFTNKASQEMKDRILEYLDDFVHGRQQGLAREIQVETGLDPVMFLQNCEDVRTTILHHYDEFSISTIDAFFQKVIRAFTRESGITGDYRLEVETDAVLEEVVNGLIDEMEEGDQLTDWVVEYARHNLENDKAWDVRHGLRIFAKEIFREEFRDIEQEVLEKSSDPAYFRRVREALLPLSQSYCEEYCRIMDSAIGVLNHYALEPEDFKSKSRGLGNFFLKANTLRKFTRADLLKNIPDQVKNYEKAEWRRPENLPASDSRKKKEVLAAAPQLIQSLEDLTNLYATSHQAALSAELILTNFYAFGLIADLSRKLKEYKDDHNLMLLADAPKFLNGVIQDSDTPFIYEKVGSFYRNFLIDEFQDTSGLQWKNFYPLIMNSVDQGHPSLIVGDVKQAIYRWRGGDLDLLQNQIVPAIGEQRVDVRVLDTNYRSAGEVVGFNNVFFRSLSNYIAQSTGWSVASDAYADVTQHTNGTSGGVVEISFLESASPLFPSAGLLAKDHWKHAALIELVKRIELLQQNGARGKDIAILIRRNQEGQEIADFLMKYKYSEHAKPGVNYNVVSSESLLIYSASSVNLLLGAMYYLLNPEDNIARARLAFEFHRLSGFDNGMHDVFSVTRQLDFEQSLPEDFGKQKAWLKKLPLVELVENLIQIFSLQRVKGEFAYLSAFEDLVIEFQQRERNDLGSFLEWWEENKDKKPIQLSGSLDAIQIITIHKSKGLQYPFVLVPFCSWGIDQKGALSYLWVKSADEYFSDIGFVPVGYSGSLKDSHFAQYYQEESNKLRLDNLNVLYVAFTRAETGLFVFAPARNREGNVDKLLENGIETSPELSSYWDPVIKRLQIGTVGPYVPASESKESTVSLPFYHSGVWRDKLVIRLKAKALFSDKGRTDESRQYGVLVHELLSQIIHVEDADRVFAKAMSSGVINANELEEVTQIFTGMMETEQVRHWFSTSWDVRTEVPVLLPDGKEHRIDRILIQGKRAVVIDFKTGDKRKDDEAQVMNYMNILRQMNFLEVEGYLMYLKNREVVQVRAGSRQKLVSRKNDKDQLQLGF